MNNFQRFHRIRRNPIFRELVAETSISPTDFIYPIFVEEGVSQKAPISTMPGVFRYPENELANHVKSLYKLGIRSIILFGVSHHKDEQGSDTWKEDGLLARMIETAKSAEPSMVVVADACVCEYTHHGHCGEIDENGNLLNDKSLVNLGKQAVTAARAGADIIAPSSMLDGQVSALRTALDEEGFSQTPIMSYSSKFSSHFYGPFRDAGGTTLKGDRNAYMLDYRNSKEALLESAADEREGADILMVKPGLLYLDIISRLHQQSDLPICCYNISGEYALLKLGVKAGIIDEKKALHETFTAFKRAGASLIITYSAVDYLKLW